VLSGWLPALGQGGGGDDETRVWGCIDADAKLSARERLSGYAVCVTFRLVPRGPSKTCKTFGEVHCRRVLIGFLLGEGRGG